MNCVVCGQEMDSVLAPELSHPSCSDVSYFSPVDTEDPFNVELKQRLLEMILYADREDPRSKQKEIGPSEIGVACDRRIAYRLSGLPEVNKGGDPWPATVGTAVHAWLKGAVDLWTGAHGPNWKTEQTIPFPDFGGVGHGDLYRYDKGTVIDWKTASKDVMKKVADKGPPEKHRIQVHIYGYGYMQMGYQVERVALAFVPRAGWIKDMFIWSEPYDQQVAVQAIQRMYRVANQAIGLNVLNEPHRWNQVEATPSDDCGQCPWFNFLRTAEQGASDQGCPGH